MDSITRIVEECYERLEPHEVALMDLYVFEKSSSLNAFMAKESKEVGVVSAPFDELFFAMHDAYRGTSRIITCLERTKKLPGLVKVGGIRHEVGHSVLHGSLLYYLLSIPPALSELINRREISGDYATNLLYLISIAVKDYEVSRLLHEHGYLDDQVAYAKHLLASTESDKIAWKMSRGTPLAEILYLVSCLKTTGCATPLLSDKTVGDELEQFLTQTLSHLPTTHSAQLLNITTESFLSLGTDTLSNIDQAAYLVVKEIIKPILLHV